jgi:hypothetical protein
MLTCVCDAKNAHDGADTGMATELNQLASSHANREKIGGDSAGGPQKEAVPILINPTPDYLFEMFFLIFLIVHLLLQNYNVHFDVSV